MVDGLQLAICNDLGCTLRDQRDEMVAAIEQRDTFMSICWAMLDAYIIPAHGLSGRWDMPALMHAKDRAAAAFALVKGE